MCQAREKMWDIQLPSWRTRQKRTAPKRLAAHTAAYLSTTARRNVQEIMKPFEACKPEDQTPPSVNQTSWRDSHAKLKPESHMNSHEAMLECWQYSKEHLTWGSQWQSEAFCHLFHDVKHRSGDDRLYFSTISSSLLHAPCVCWHRFVSTSTSVCKNKWLMRTQKHNSILWVYAYIDKSMRQYARWFQNHGRTTATTPWTPMDDSEPKRRAEPLGLSSWLLKKAASSKMHQSLRQV